jgi:hypothetical protein
MPKPSLSQSLEWSARDNRFRRLMFVDIDEGPFGMSLAVTSNLSRRGLAIIGDCSLERGDKTWIGFGNDRPLVPAKVIWRDGRRLGLAFDKELSLVEYFGARIAVNKRSLAECHVD